MKLSDLFKPISYAEPPKFKRPPRTNAPMQPKFERPASAPRPSQPTTEGCFQVPTPPFRPKPSRLLRDLRDVMPEKPAHDHESFTKTTLYSAMLKQAQEGDSALAIDCESKRDEILLDEFIKWEVWLIEQGVSVESSLSTSECVEEEYYIISWGEAEKET